MTNISVEELLEVSYLELEMYAGGAGLRREIVWAHVSELSDPSQWVAPGTLVMTTGLGLPNGPEAQDEYVSRLAVAGIGGLLVGEHPSQKINAPELTGAMAEAADEYSFPIITMPYELPFSGVAEVVAQASQEQQHSRLVQALQIYDSVRLMGASVSGSKLVEQLARVAGCELHVLDPTDGTPLFSGSSFPGTRVSQAVVTAFKQDTATVSSLRRITSKSRPIVALRLAASREAVLVASSRTEVEPDLFVLRHVAAVVAWEVEKNQAERERRRRLGAELLADLLENRIEGEVAAKMLADWDLQEEPLAMAAVHREDIDEHAELHLRLEQRGVKHLIGRRRESVALLLPSTETTANILTQEIDSAIGVSDVLGRLTRTSDAVREALWALQEAKATGKKLVRYGENTTSHFLPRTLSESQAAVRHILGPVSDYDDEHGTQLVASLWSYLRNNRSLKKAAAELHVHRQTVVYRLHQVETLTGRSLDSMEEAANLWFALRAMREIG